MDFAQKIYRSEDLEPIERHGEYLLIIPYKNSKEEIIGIVHLITVFRKSSYESLGIICKTESQAEEIVQHLSFHVKDIHFYPAGVHSLLKELLLLQHI